MCVLRKVRSPSILGELNTGYNEEARYSRSIRSWVLPSMALLVVLSIVIAVVGDVKLLAADDLGARS